MLSNRIAVEVKLVAHPVGFSEMVLSHTPLQGSANRVRVFSYPLNCAPRPFFTHAQSPAVPPKRCQSLLECCLDSGDAQHPSGFGSRNQLCPCRPERFLLILLRSPLDAAESGSLSCLPHLLARPHSLWKIARPAK